MGDLPDARVNRMERAFVYTGVDYAGPIVIRTAPAPGFCNSVIDNYRFDNIVAHIFYISKNMRNDTYQTENCR